MRRATDDEIHQDQRIRNKQTMRRKKRSQRTERVLLTSDAIIGLLDLRPQISDSDLLGDWKQTEEGRQLM